MDSEQNESERIPPCLTTLHDIILLIRPSSHVSLWFCGAVTIGDWRLILMKERQGKHDLHFGNYLNSFKRNCHAKLRADIGISSKIEILACYSCPKWISFCSPVLRRPRLQQTCMTHLDTLWLLVYWIRSIILTTAKDISWSSTRLHLTVPTSDFISWRYEIS